MASSAACPVSSLPSPAWSRAGCRARSRVSLSPSKNAFYPSCAAAPTCILKSAFSGSDIRSRCSRLTNDSRVRMSVSSSVVLEESTGISFPTDVTMPGSSNKLVLLGTGVREKKIAILNVKVYAVAIYAQENLFPFLSSYKGKTTSELQGDGSFFKSIIDAPVEKSILIILARDVEGSQFWAALDESMAPRLKAAGAGQDGEDALKQFGGLFSNRSLKKGTSVYLTWAQPTSLMVSISDSGAAIPSEALATIDSPPLLSVLFDLYLGEVSVSPPLKSSIAKISNAL